jgi:hypothetical protein
MDLLTEGQWEYAARNRGQMISFAIDNGKVEPERNVWAYQLNSSAVRPVTSQARQQMLRLARHALLASEAYEWSSVFQSAIGMDVRP